MSNYKSDINSASASRVGHYGTIQMLYYLLCMYIYLFQ